MSTYERMSVHSSCMRIYCVHIVHVCVYVMCVYINIMIYVYTCKYINKMNMLHSKMPKSTLAKMSSKHILHIKGIGNSYYDNAVFIYVREC